MMPCFFSLFKFHFNVVDYHYWGVSVAHVCWKTFMNQMMDLENLF